MMVPLLFAHNACCSTFCQQKNAKVPALTCEPKMVIGVTQFN